MRSKQTARHNPGRGIHNENTAFNSNHLPLPGPHETIPDDYIHAAAPSHLDSDPTPLAERPSGHVVDSLDLLFEPLGMNIPCQPPFPMPATHTEQSTSTCPETMSSNVWEIGPGDLTPAGKHRRATEVADAFTDKYSRADSNLFDAASVVNSESATFMISKKNGDSFEQRSNVFLSADGVTAAVTALYKAAQQHELRAKPEQSERKRKRDDTADERRDLEASSPLTIIKLKVDGLASSSSASAVATSPSPSPAASAQTPAFLESCKDLIRMQQRMEQLVRHLCDKKPAYSAQIDQATRSGIHANLNVLSNLYGLDS